MEAIKMLESELVTLVKNIQSVRSESNRIEIKAAAKGCPKVRDTLSSFSNQSGGGVIVFGIDENENYNLLFTVALVDEKTVVSAEIQEIDNTEKPCFYSGVGRLKGSYIRSGDADRLMTEYEVYSFEAFKKKIQDELRISERAVMKDMQTKAFDLYINLLRNKKPNLAELPNEDLCRLQGFTENEKPTLAGLMLFSNYPQAFFPQLCITAVSVPGTEISSTGPVGERFIDNKRLDGTLVQMLNGAMLFVRNNMKTATIIDTNTGKRTDKTEYPVIAIRELVLNALIHRDYSIHTDSAPITIRMFSDRLEIENPGGLYGRMTLDRLGKFAADTRNPAIANAMEILGETENRYSGIPTIINAMEEYGLPAPKFESDRGIFKVTLYNQSKEKIVSDPVMAEIMDFCRTPKSRSELETLFKGRMTIAYLMEKYVKPMTEKNQLALTIPEKPKSKNQKYYTL